MIYNLHLKIALNKVIFGASVRKKLFYFHTVHRKINPSTILSFQVDTSGLKPTITLFTYQPLITQPYTSLTYHLQKN